LNYKPKGSPKPGVSKLFCQSVT